MWWVAIAGAAELEGFVRQWVDPAALSLSPVAVEGAVAAVALALHPGEAAEPIAAAAREAGFGHMFDADTVFIQGEGAELLTVAGRPLADFGTVRRIPALRSRLPGAPAALVIENPTTRRAEVEVGGVLIGRLNPRATGAIVGIPAGGYAVALTGPDGERREAELWTVLAHEGLTAPPAATLPGALAPR